MSDTLCTIIYHSLKNNDVSQCDKAVVEVWLSLGTKNTWLRVKEGSLPVWCGLKLLHP